MGFDPNKEDQRMARKRFKPEEIVAKLRQSLPRTELCWKMGDAA